MDVANGLLNDIYGCRCGTHSPSQVEVVHLGMEAQRGETMFARLLRLVSHVFPTKGKEYIAEILGLRCTGADGFEELVQTEEAQALIGDPDLGSDDEQPERVVEKHVGDEYRRELAQYRPAQRVKGPRKKVTATPTTMSVEDVASFLPPGVRLWKDTWNQRWQLSARGSRIGSKSFAMYGFEEASRMIAHLAWKHFVAKGGNEPSDPSVRDFIRWTEGAAPAAAKARGGTASSSGSGGNRTSR